MGIFQDWLQPKISKLVEQRKLEALVDALRGSKRERRRDAERALREMDGSDVTKALIQGLQEGNSRAARVLAERGDHEAIPSLCQALEHPEMAVHQEARAALVVLQADPALREVFKNSKVSKAREMAFRALSELKPDDFEELASQALEDPSDDVRSLVEFRGAKPRLLKSSDDSLRLAAVRALSTRGLEEELDQLITALDDSVAHIRATALDGLAYTWEQSDWDDEQRALELVSEKVTDESRDVRAAACSALGRMGLGIIVLREALKDPDAPVRDSAALALGKHRDKDSIEALGALVQSGSWAAVRALGEIGDSVAIPMLIQALGSPNLAGVAAQSLGTLGDSAAIPALERFVAKGFQGTVVRDDPSPLALAKHSLELLRSKL